MAYILEMTGFNPLSYGQETNYQKYESKEEAVAYFKRVISNYPNVFTFKMYEMNEVEGLPYELQEQAKAVKTAEYLEQMEKNAVLNFMTNKLH